MNYKVLIHKFVCLLLLTASVFTVSRSFPDAMIEPKWFAAGLATLIFGLLWALNTLFSKESLRTCRLIAAFEISTTIVCSSQALLFLLQEIGVISAYGRFTAGSFDNVAGFASCLCLSIPLGYRLLGSYGRIYKVFFWTCKAICAIAVILSASRIGIVCLIVMTTLFLLRNHKKMLLVSIPIIITVMVVLTLTVKTNSSRGRWFIYCQAIEMIAERPFAGWGKGAFLENYMNRQADYFREHPDSEYAILADNVRHPLNEILLITVEYGLLGLTVVVFAAIAVLMYYKKHRTEIGKLGLAVLLCIMLFSLFSYPFLYPFTWIMLAFALLCIFSDKIRFTKNSAIVVLFLLPLGSYYYIKEIRQELEFGETQEKAGYGLARKMLPRYAALYETKSDDYLFLYNYAAMQFDAGRYEEAGNTAKECSEILADYDLCLLRGDIEQELGNCKSAIAFYWQAYYMCPSRFVPLYEIYKIHRRSGNLSEQNRLADMILNKEIKIDSEEIRRIKEDVRHFMDLSSSK